MTPHVIRFLGVLAYGIAPQVFLLWRRADGFTRFAVFAVQVLATVFFFILWEATR